MCVHAVHLHRKAKVCHFCHAAPPAGITCQQHVAHLQIAVQHLQGTGCASQVVRKGGGDSVKESPKQINSTVQ